MDCLNAYKVPGGPYVRCGQCRNCKRERAREWSLRMMHELCEWNGQAVFLTLTYNEESELTRLNWAASLAKEELQNYFKRLRKILEPRRIKYYGVGEYGERYGRPHYHAVVFGLSFEEHKVQRFLSKKGNTTYLVVAGPALQAWSPRKVNSGNVHIGTVTKFSTRYVASYLHKSYNGRMSEYYGKYRIQPFAIQSQGFGKQFAIQNIDQMVEMAGALQGGREVGLPRYYRNVIEEHLEDIDGGKLVSEFKEKIRKKAESFRKEELEGITESGEHVLEPYRSKKSDRERTQKARNAEARKDMYTQKL